RFFSSGEAEVDTPESGSTAGYCCRRPRVVSRQRRVIKRTGIELTSKRVTHWCAKKLRATIATALTSPSQPPRFQGVPPLTGDDSPYDAPPHAFGSFQVHTA